MSYPIMSCGRAEKVLHYVIRMRQKTRAVCPHIADFFRIVGVVAGQA